MAVLSLITSKSVQSKIKCDDHEIGQGSLRVKSSLEVIMKQLEEAILKYGSAINEQVLKVDTFLNHQIDPNLMYLMAVLLLLLRNHFSQDVSG